MSPQVIGILLVVGFIVLYFVTYILNAKTEAPEGVEKISKCASCSSGACSVNIKEKYMSSNEDTCDTYEEGH